MNRPDTQRAIMFSDVAGSSALYKEMEDADAKALVDKAVSMMREVTETFDGSVIKVIGDEVMACFEDAGKAMRAAVAIQERSPYLSTHNPISIRIGLAWGPVLSDNGDLFGETVNDAAYVSHVARGHQIVVTEALVGALDAPARERCQRFDHVTLKGARSGSTLYRYEWEVLVTASGPATMMLTGGFGDPTAEVRMKLTHRGQQWLLSPDATPFRLGRDPAETDLQIDVSHASRDHCHILFRRGRYVLSDHSTNGTYLRPDGRAAIFLRREEAPLTGSGTISLGRPAEKAGEFLVGFDLEV